MYYENLKEILLIIPLLNPNKQLSKNIEEMLSMGFSNILLVSNCEIKNSHNEITIIGYEENKGALKTAFSYALEHFSNLKGIVTAGGNAQYFTKDIAKVALTLLENQDKAVFGCRDSDKKNIPFKNQLGYKITSLVFKVLFALKIDDAKTTLRAFPMNALLKLLTVEGEGIEYESNVLMHLKEFKLEIVNVKIDIYDETAGYFKSFKDFILMYKPVLLYSLSGCSTEFLELVLFTLMLFLLGSEATKLNLMISTVFARIIGSIFNFIMNKKTVFKSKSPAKKSIIRFYIVSAIQMTCSYLGVAFFTKILGIDGLGATIIKLFADVFLSIFNFRVQKTWVFIE